MRDAEREDRAGGTEPRDAAASRSDGDPSRASHEDIEAAIRSIADGKTVFRTEADLDPLSARLSEIADPDVRAAVARGIAELRKVFRGERVAYAFEHAERVRREGIVKLGYPPPPTMGVRRIDRDSVPRVLTPEEEDELIALHYDQHAPGWRARYPSARAYLESAARQAFERGGSTGSLEELVRDVRKHVVFLAVTRRRLK